MTTATASVSAVPRHHVFTWRHVLEFGIALGVIAAVVIAIRMRSSASKGQLQFDTAAVVRGPLQARVTASGTVNALVTVQVGSQVSGTIEALGADFNSIVKRGQMIARIEPGLYRTAVLQARANLLSARAGVEKAAAQLLDAQRLAARDTLLLAKTLISQAEYDSAVTAVTVADAQLDGAKAAQAQASAAQAQAQLNLSYTTIVSPINGVVITRNIDVGQTVAASFAAPTLFLIGEDLKKMQVDTNIPEADVGRLAKGMPTSFTVDAYPGETFRGAIREVRNSPQTIQNVVTYDAVIDVDNSGLKLKPGMTANLNVTYADRADVVKIPNAALRFRPPISWMGKPAVPPAPASDHKTVWILRAAAPVAVSVRTGVSDGSFSELLEGDLKVGDALITEAISNQPAHAM